MNTTPIGLIGVGLVGTALAERLLDSGFQVLGFDPDGNALTRLKEAGGDAADSARAVTAQCQRVVLSLPHSGIVAQVIEEIELAGKLIIDTSTGDPDTTVTIGDTVAKRGARYLDATIGGSSQQMRERDVIVLCGGAADAFAECLPIFDTFAKRTFYLGPVGSGSRMKLVLNLVLGLNRAVLAEGLGYAAASGIDMSKALEVLKAGPAYSRAMDIKGEKMIRGDFSLQARLSQHLKDVRLILETGAHSGATLPLSSAHRQLLEELESAGFGGVDNSAIIRAFRREA